MCAQIFRIPTSSELYLTAIRDDLDDTFDVIDLTFNYLNDSFPAAWAYWKMEEESGTRYDATGNDRDLSDTEEGTEYGQYMSRATGKAGYAIQFDDSVFQGGVRLYRDGWPDLTSENPFSFSVWVNVDDTYSGFDLYCGDLTLYFGGEYVYSCGWGSAYVDGEATAGGWHHFAVTFDGTTMKLYVDGTMVSESEGTTECDPLDTYIYVYGFEGVVQVDEVGIWTQALAADQITYLYNSGSGRTLY